MEKCCFDEEKEARTQTFESIAIRVIPRKPAKCENEKRRSHLSLTILKRGNAKFLLRLL